MKKLLPNSVRIFLFASLFIVHYSLFTKPALAQVSLIVSPPRYDEIVDPGATIQKTVKITNNSDQEITLRVDVHDFIVQDDSGTPVLVTESASGRYLASPWFTLNRNVLTLAPNATEIIYAIITAPTDALPGGHYAGIYFSPSVVTTPESSTGAGIEPKIGALFSLTIAGDINYDAFIKDFTVDSRLYEYGPIDFRAIIENLSDTHIRPLTSITIRDMFGRQLETLVLDEVNIFPFTTRTLLGSWDTTWGLGRYTATLEASYGPGLVADRTIFFWILPYRILAAIGVLLLVLIVIFISVRRHLAHKGDTRDTEIDQLKRRISELENQS